MQKMSKRFKKSRCNEKQEDTLITAIKQNNLDAVEKIINQVGLSFSKLWLGGYTLLRIAIDYDRLEIASWLLSKSCNINRLTNDDISDTPLHMAVFHENTSLVESLLKYGADTTAKNVKGETALHISCRNQNLTISDLLLKHSTEASISDEFLMTPLHIAVENECLNLVELLLNHNVDINARTIKPGYEGCTALHIAIIKQNYEMVKVLLENGADSNAAIGTSQLDAMSNKDFHIVHAMYQSYTPLHLAIEQENDNIVESLLKHNADANIILDHNGLTPLHIAVQNSDEKRVMLLSNYNADFCKKTTDGRSILHIAFESDWPYLIEVLVCKNANIDEQTEEGETLLFMAVEMGDENWVEFLLQLNANTNIKNIRHQTPLHIASEFSEEIVKMLLAHGASVDEIDADNETPLSIAIKHRDMAIIKEILDCKPSIHNESNKSGFTYATKNIDSEIMDALIDYGFLWTNENVDADLIYSLISQCQLHSLEHLLKNGPEIISSIKKENKSCFIQKAVRNEDIEMVQLLIEHQFNLNVVDTYGKSAIDYAIATDNIDILNLLLQNDAKINDFTLPLLYSVKNRNIKLFEKLLHSTNNVSVSDEFGTTPLHFAAWNKDYEFAQILIDNNAFINTTDNCCDQNFTKNIDKGFYSYINELKKHIFTSPLHIAVGKKDEAIATMFLECHANVNSKDGYGRSPLHIAAAMKSQEQNALIEMLLRYGANINVLDNFKRLPIYYLYNHSCVCSVAFQNQYHLYNECECDLYEEDELNNVMATFVKHIVLLTSMKEEVSTGNYIEIEKNEFSKNLQITCLNEILIMKETKLLDHISFHDILSKKSNMLTLLTRNEELVQAFETTNYADQFPLYCDMIEDKFYRAQNRNQLLERALFSFNNLTNFILPQTFIENVFDVLLSNDLRMVIEACKDE